MCDGLAIECVLALRDKNALVSDVGAAVVGLSSNIELSAVNFSRTQMIEAGQSAKGRFVAGDDVGPRFIDFNDAAAKN